MKPLAFVSWKYNQHTMKYTNLKRPIQKVLEVIYTQRSGTFFPQKCSFSPFPDPPPQEHCGFYHYR